MSAIAGFCNLKQDFTKEDQRYYTILNEMKKTQKRRGPDDDGLYLTSCCGLSHTRLSIIDAKNGHQPIIRKEGCRECTIVYDGVLYNMHELKRELLRDGASFLTASDGEVVLLGYMKYGPDFVKKCNGVFAFAIWDSAFDSFLLFRDRLGAKPLFYAMLEDTFLFASEIKALFAYPGFKPIINQESLQEIFGLGPAKTPGKGVFANVGELLPGHYMILDEYGLHTYPYWSLISAPHTDNFENTVQKTAYLLEDSVKKQMLSDLPVSTFLSGGVDSSLVTAICSRELEKQGQKLTTFSFDYTDNHLFFQSNSFQPSEDRPYVDKMVSYFKTSHTYLECPQETLADYLYKAVDARDLPCMADVESSLLYFCSEVADTRKVALTGECADEIFGGYPWFHKKDCLDADIFPWSMDMGMRTLLLKDEVAFELNLNEYAKAAYETSLSEVPLIPSETAEEKRRREISYLNLKWFMVTLLDRMDRTSMYSGLDARAPFADHRIVEYLWNVPWHMKCPGGLVKGLLREAGKKYLPEDILYRKKSPYPKTYNPAYEKLLHESLLTVLSDSNAPLNRYLDKPKVLQYMSSPSDYTRPFYGQLMAGPQLIAYLLQINYWMQKYGTV